MDTSLYVAMARQVSLDREFDLVAQNIANMNTAGYKAERMLFDEALSRVGDGEKVAFVIDRADYMVEKPGYFQTTDNPFDLAVDGPGWFQVQTPSGVMYTRDGRFKLNDNGVITTREGHPVLGAGGAPIIIPVDQANRVQIVKDGTITVYTDNFGILDEQEFGRIGLVEFSNPQNLWRQGDTLYRSSEPAQPSVTSSVKQGMFEGSNVEPILELTRMLDLSQAHQAAGRFIENGDQLKRDAIQRLGNARG